MKKTGVSNWGLGVGIGLILLLTTNPQQPIPAAYAATKSGAIFLAINQGARFEAMGGSAFAMSDISSLFHNPAGTALLSRQQAAMSHTELFADTRMETMGYVLPTNIGRIGFSGLVLTQGALEGRNALGAQTGNFNASDLALGVSLSRPFQMGLTRAGANIKLVQQKIADETAQSWAVDVGVQRNLRTDLTLGLGVLNIGPKLKFIEKPFNLPLTVGGGVSYLLGGMVTVTADIKHRIYDNRMTAGIGTEFWVMPPLALRAGYLGILKEALDSDVQSSSRKLDGSLKGLGAGFGFKISNLSGNDFLLDYALSPARDLGTAHRISFSLRFGPIFESNHPKQNTEKLLLLSP